MVSFVIVVIYFSPILFALFVAKPTFPLWGNKVWLMCHTCQQLIAGLWQLMARSPCISLHPPLCSFWLVHAPNPLIWILLISSHQRDLVKDHFHQTDREAMIQSLETGKGPEHLWSVRGLKQLAYLDAFLKTSVKVASSSSQPEEEVDFPFFQSTVLVWNDHR